jgi:hypothetical protein
LNLLLSADGQACGRDANKSREKGSMQHLGTPHYKTGIRRIELEGTQLRYSMFHAAS